MGALMGKQAARSDCESKRSVDEASSSYTRIESMRDLKKRSPGSSKEEAEIEASKVHWSEVSETGVDLTENAADNAEVFQILKKQWPSDGGDSKFSWEWQYGGVSVVRVKPHAPKSFWDWHSDDLIYDFEKPFAEGGQAEIFEARGTDYGEELVLKVFKPGSSLRDLQRLLPHGMLGDKSTRSSGYFSGGKYCNGILGAALLKDGRFAFIMHKCWGDLRKLIECRMEHNDGQDPPFSDDVATRCMWQIAKGMQSLHAKALPHRDLKASNVLIQKKLRYKSFDPIHDNEFYCKVTDFECSVGVQGTGFWRAPEILDGLKNRNKSVTELFTTKSDVYSYAMTCYEILSGCMPFEGHRGNDYDVVLHGNRPKLPHETPPWMKDLLNRCWDRDPSSRPTFEEIVDLLEKNGGIQSDSTSVAIS